MHSSATLETIARQFFPIDVWMSAIPIGSGNINDTYRIDFLSQNERHTWLLQRLNHRVFTDPDAVMRNISMVAKHLTAQPGFPLEIPEPVTGPDGRFLQRDADGNFWRVFPFFEHTYAPERLPEPAVAGETAQAYGAFLRALRGLDAGGLAETIPGFHDTDRRWTVFQNTLEQDPAGRASTIRVEIEAMHRAQPVFEAVSRLKQRGALPTRVTHNDTKAGNVLLDTRTGRAVAVIDWDTLMPGTVLSDFGDMVRTFAPDGPEDSADAPALRLDALAALCEGFLRQTADFLCPEERENLPLGAQWIIGEQALRFLTDYLAGDVYYKTQYPEHNLVRARNQLALFEAVSAHLPFIAGLL